MDSHNKDNKIIDRRLNDVSMVASVPRLEQRQQLLAHHTRLLARKASHALFALGSQSGLGKTRTILRTLEDEGISPILIPSRLTPLALYGMLLQKRDDEVLFFDDCDALCHSAAHLDLLRLALWTPRIVSYGGSKLPKDLPPSFQTTARYIFAATNVPKKVAAFDSLLNRCEVVRLEATNAEICEMMRSIAAKGFRDLTSQDCKNLIDFIEQNVGDYQLSLRLLAPSLQKLLYARSEGIDWRPLVKCQLQAAGRKHVVAKRLDAKAADFWSLEKAIQAFPGSVTEQQVEWCKVTGKSRASFYRNLACYRAQHSS